MNPSLRLTLVIAICLYFFVIFLLLKKNELNLKYTLLWLVTGICMLFVVIFPLALEKLSKVFGIIEMTNAVFAMMIFFLILIMMSITAIVSKLNSRNRALIQQCALYEKRIRKLEDKVEKSEK